jgi:hypothetical protein
MSLKIDGLSEFEADLRTAAGNIKPEIRVAMNRSVNYVKNDAQKFALYRTGNLRRSIFTVVKDGGLRGEVGQDSSMAPYGRSVEYGSKPHVIIATRRRVLADRRKGIVFGRIVMHPGFRGKAFMSPAYEHHVLGRRQIVQHVEHDGAIRRVRLSLRAVTHVADTSLIALEMLAIARIAARTDDVGVTAVH